MKWYIHAFKNYANFGDRASRTEYWMFGLFNFYFGITTYTIDLIFDLGVEKYGIGLLYSIYLLISFIPSIAITVRRLHDVDKSGSYLFLAIIPLANIYLIALLCTKSDEEDNAFGDKPVNNDIAEFIYNDTSASNVIIGAVLWLFLNKIIWSFFSKFVDNYYQNKKILLFGELTNLIWLFFPLALALTVKNHKWKIVLIIGSVVYTAFSFYDILKAHFHSNNF